MDNGYSRPALLITAYEWKNVNEKLGSVSLPQLISGRLHITAIFSVSFVILACGSHAISRKS
jgi:hypothetical protein